MNKENITNSIGNGQADLNNGDSNFEIDNRLQEFMLMRINGGTLSHEEDINPDD